MRTQTPVRALGLVALILSCALGLGACAAPPTPTGPVEGWVTDAGLIGNAGVVVRAQGRTAITDGEGRFTLDGIAVPYDLSLSQSSGDGWLHVIEGLTDRTPVLDPIGTSAFAGPAPSASVTGALTGAAPWPLPAGRRVVVCAEGLGVIVAGCDTVNPGASSYALSATFLDGAAGTVRFHALRILTDAEGRPTGYEGYGVADAVVEAGVPVAVPIELAVLPAVGDLEVAFDVPGGATLTSVLVTVRLGTSGSLVLFQGSGAGSTLSLPVPTLPGARYAVFAAASAGGGTSTVWSVDDALEVGPLVFGVPPQLAQPADGAVDATAATTFEAVVPGSGPRTFRWTTAGGPSFALTTTRSSVALPDPTGAGFAWPSGAAYTWRVRTHDAATIDEAAAALDTGALSLGIFMGTDVPPSGTLTESDAHGVTFAP